MFPTRKQAQPATMGTNLWLSGLGDQEGIRPFATDTFSDRFGPFTSPPHGAEQLRLGGCSIREGGAGGTSRV